MLFENACVCCSTLGISAGGGQRPDLCEASKVWKSRFGVKTQEKPAPRRTWAWSGLGHEQPPGTPPASCRVPNPASAVSSHRWQPRMEGPQRTLKLSFQPNPHVGPACLRPKSCQTICRSWGEGPALGECKLTSLELLPSQADGNKRKITILQIEFPKEAEPLHSPGSHSLSQKRTKTNKEGRGRHPQSLTDARIYLTLPC